MEFLFTLKSWWISRKSASVMDSVVTDELHPESLQTLLAAMSLPMLLLAPSNSSVIFSLCNRHKNSSIIIGISFFSNGFTAQQLKSFYKTILLSSNWDFQKTFKIRYSINNLGTKFIISFVFYFGGVFELKKILAQDFGIIIRIVIARSLNPQI